MEAVRDQFGHDIPAFRQGTTQKVDFTGTAGTIGTPFTRKAKLVKITVTKDAYVKIGAAASATDADEYFPANVPDYRGVETGDVVSAVKFGADDGTLFVTEMK